MKKKVLISIIIIILLLILCLHYWEYPIDKDYSCIQFTIGEENYKEVKVKISGTIKKSLIRDDIAELKFQFNDKEFPNTLIHPYIFPINFTGIVASNNKIRFNPTDKVEQNIIENGEYSIIELEYKYWDGKAKFPSTEVFGKLYFDKDFESIAITVYKHEGNGFIWCFSQYEIIVSESNIDDAISLAEDLTGMYLKN